MAETVEVVVIGAGKPGWRRVISSPNWASSTSCWNGVGSGSPGGGAGTAPG